jgi:two-component system response regulator PhoP
VRVLVIEDEVRLSENIAAALREGAGFAVDCALDGETGWQLTRNPAAPGAASCYDLIVLDLMLPGLDGLAVLKRVRAARDRTPVLILTARGERKSVIELLNAGADDYLTKPFDLGELVARAKALIRRGKGGADPTLRLNEIELNTLEQTVQREGRYVELSPMEYRILEYLMHRPRVIVSKRELLEHLYDYNWEHHSNVIEAHVSNLRKKLDGDSLQSSIETLRGRGYRLSLSQAAFETSAPEAGGRG